MYTCPKCKKPISNSVRTLIRHLRQVHAVSDAHDYTIICSQNHCQRTYHNFNSYARHLNREHNPDANSQHLEHLDLCGLLEDISVPSCSHAIDTSETDLSADLDTPRDLQFFDHRECAASFVAKMYSSSNATWTDVQKSITCTKELLDKTLDSLKDKTASVINSYSIPNDDVQSLMQDFENARDMFSEVDTPYKMLKYFSEKHSLVKPTEIFLGHRGDTARKQGKLSQVLAADTFQYISIIDTIKFLFGNETMQKLYWQSTKSHDGKMRDYCDGTHFANHPLYSRYPNALQIQMYFDDLETTNPLGSKTKIHKMGAVYFCLRNLPVEFNSSLANIHLCLLFNSIDREVYGFDKIFAPFLDDIRRLETDGIEVEIEGQLSVLHGTICLLTGDNLACHSLGGFLESFSANRFCHFCLTDRQTAQCVFDDDHQEFRDKINYKEHVLQNNPSLTGIKTSSCLNSLNYFHVTDNICVDVMHDILEGVALVEVKLLLKRYIHEEKLFTLDQFNDRLQSFDYGVSNEKNKPSVVLNLKSDNPIRQTASQMWCLLLFLPFLIGDFVSEDDHYWKLFLLLREICSIVFSPVVSVGLCVFLKQLVIDHHDLFKTLYPDRPLTPKHHFMTHYWRIMIKFGPLLKLWCMRFESKHGPLKRHAHVVCNFINISKTLAYKMQVQSMYNWKFGNPLIKKMTVSNSFAVMVGSLKKCDLLIQNLNALGHDVSTCSIIHVAHSVFYFGHTYRTGSVLVLKNYDLRGECLFGEIVHIVLNSEKEEVLCFLRILTVVYFDYHLFSYVVQRSNEYKMEDVKGLSDTRPLDILSSGQNMFVNPRYKLID